MVEGHRVYDSKKQNLVEGAPSVRAGALFRSIMNSRLVLRILGAAWIAVAMVTFAGTYAQIYEDTFNWASHWRRHETQIIISWIIFLIGAVIVWSSFRISKDS